MQAGRKTFELRVEDTRTFAVGDVLLLREYDDTVPVATALVRRYGPRWRTIVSGAIEQGDASLLDCWAYTGAECRVLVTHVLRDPEEHWLQPGVAALSIRLLDTPSSYHVPAHS